MESRLIFRHLQKALKLSITQIAKVGEAVSWLLQAHTALKPGENGLSPKRQFEIGVKTESRSQLR